jgi:ABC-2 type transport system permease protein
VLRMLIQLPYRPPTLIFAKVVAIAAAWWLASIPVLCSLVLWKISGGHLGGLETSNLIIGHFVYGLLIGSVALFAASIAESAATAAIITLAFTIGSWVLYFTLAGQPGLLDWLSRLSMTQVLRLSMLKSRCDLGIRLPATLASDDCISATTEFAMAAMHHAWR